MDTIQTPIDENKIEADIKTSGEQDEKQSDNNENQRFEGKVTAEQELSASVARRRRNISKKRSESAHRPRDVTPARDLLTDSPNDNELPPKTPERKLKKTGSNNSNKSSKNGNDTNEKREVENNNVSKQDENKNSTNEENKEKIVNVTSELDSLQNHTKRSAPREKPARMKRDKLLKKRSQSTPRPSTEDEEKGTKDDFEQQKIKLKKEKEISDLKKDTAPSNKNEIDPSEEEKKVKLKREKEPAEQEKIPPKSEKDLVEDFKQAQILSAKLEVIFKPSSSESSVESTESNQEEKVRRRKPLKPYAPAAQQYLERRRLEKQLSETKSEEKKVEKPKSRFSPKEILSKWRQFKTEYSDEYNKIKSMRNKCINEIILLMIFCGFGGMIFKFTEGALENFYKCGVKRVRRDFIEILWRGSHNLREEDWKALARTKLRDMEEQLHEAHEAGVHTYSGQRSWSFLNGIVYSLTIVTTIGKK